MGKVEVLDDEWVNEGQHRMMYTDIFMFSSEEKHDVEMTLGPLSYNILKEEYPASKKYISKLPDNQWYPRTSRPSLVAASPRLQLCRNRTFRSRSL